MATNTPHVIISTRLGEIEIELLPARLPVTSRTFSARAAGRVRQDALPSRHSRIHDPGRRSVNEGSQGARGRHGTGGPVLRFGPSSMTRIMRAESCRWLVRTIRQRRQPVLHLRRRFGIPRPPVHRFRARRARHGDGGLHREPAARRARQSQRSRRNDGQGRRSGLAIVRGDPMTRKTRSFWRPPCLFAMILAWSRARQSFRRRPARKRLERRRFGA